MKLTDLHQGPSPRPETSLWTSAASTNFGAFFWALFLRCWKACHMVNGHLGFILLYSKKDRFLFLRDKNNISLCGNSAKHSFDKPLISLPLDLQRYVEGHQQTFIAVRVGGGHGYRSGEDCQGGRPYLAPGIQRTCAQDSSSRVLVTWALASVPSSHKIQHYHLYSSPLQVIYTGAKQPM